jgi:hypothetical protein
MPETTLSIREMLGLGPGGFPVEGMLKAGLPDAELKALQTQVSSALPGMPWSDVQSVIGEKFSEALDIDPINLFAAAWTKYSVLSDAAKQSKAGETILVPMAEHAVKSELHPYVEIQLGPVTKKIEFIVALSLKLKGVIVKVQSEEIRAIQAGTCEGSGEIGIAGQSLWKHAIKPVPLPGTIKTGAGIPIR